MRANNLEKRHTCFITESLCWTTETERCSSATSACAMQSLQACPTLHDPMGCSPPGSSDHGILQARILEWVAMPSSRGSSWPRDQTQVSCSSCIAGEFLTPEPPGKYGPTMLQLKKKINSNSSQCLIMYQVNYISRLWDSREESTRVGFCWWTVFLGRTVTSVGSCSTGKM